MAIQRSSKSRRFTVSVCPSGRARRTGPTGAGRGEKSDQDCPIHWTSSEPGGGKVQSIRGASTSVTSRAMNCVPPARSEKMATEWNSPFSFVRLVLASTQTSRDMMFPSTVYWCLSPIRSLSRGSMSGGTKAQRSSPVPVV